MLVQFSVQNYKAFKDRVKLTLFASNSDKSTREAENVFEVPKFGLRLLKSAVVYGANASGKTKLIDAVHFFKNFIESSSKESQQREKINTDPFRLNTVNETSPSFFEIVFIHENEMFRYGFEVTKDSVISEWLFHRPETKEVEIFSRDGQEFEIHAKHFQKGAFLKKEGMVRPNTLMLSLAAQFNDAISTKVLTWLGNFNQLSGLSDHGYMGYSMNMARQPEGKARFLDWLKSADIGIDDFEVQTLDLESIPESMPKNMKKILTQRMKEKGAEVFGDVKTFHGKFDDLGNRIGMEEFLLSEEESMGTRKLFALAGPIMTALDKGEVLFADELDSKLHPNLVEKIVGLFNSATTNPKNAQLLFNTHNTNLLGPATMFRRDQIWLAEKDRLGAVSLFSLASFKTDEVRKGDNFEVKYLQGKFGGIPVLGDFSTQFTSEKELT